MNSNERRCEQQEALAAYSLHALPPAEAEALEAHMSQCAACLQEWQRLRPVVDALVDWPMDVLRPPTSLWNRLLERIEGAARTETAPATTPWPEPSWEEVAPGITCKLLASDRQGGRVSMLVRLAPGISYPPHRHAAVEELHLLDGELWIDGRKLLPGDYNRAEPGTADAHVWSETGCSCLLITSSSDVLG